MEPGQRDLGPSHARPKWPMHGGTKSKDKDRDSLSFPAAATWYCVQNQAFSVRQMHVVQQEVCRGSSQAERGWRLSM